MELGSPGAIREQEMATEYVSFLVGDERFAIEMSCVQEIIRVPSIVEVPRSPASLMGLANLRGQVLPILDLRMVFGFPDKELEDCNRIVVAKVGQIWGFLVDKVLSVIGGDAVGAANSSESRSIVSADFLKGVIKDNIHGGMLMVIDIERIINSELIQTSTFAQKDAAETSTSTEEKQSENQGEERQFVSFSIGGEEYAIDMNSIKEIVQIPEKIVKMPNTAHWVVGVMNLREKVLPLVSSRRIFNLEEKPLDEADRIIVLNLRDLSVGLVVDTVKEVLRVPESVIERLPSILSHGRENYEISEVCKLDHGKRLVSVICVSNLLPHKEVTEVMREMSRCNPDQSLTNEEETEDEEQVVVFLLDGGEYAVSIRRVQEIVRVPEELTKVPKTPPFVEGVINLRGTVLPVIDLRKRLDVSLRERDESERIVVLTIGEISVGFIVDTVAEVLKIPRNLIQEAPHLSHEQVKLLGRIANLEKEGRMIQLIDPDTLLGEQEVQTLAQEAA